MADIQLHESWREPLKPQFNSLEMQSLKAFLQSERQAGKTIFPRPAYWFAALDTVPLDEVKVVILGQDPYHGHDNGTPQAHGFSFSVPEGVRVPPSLVNIYKELEGDLGIAPANHGNLERWAAQGVLLLNSVLTVEAHKAASHKGQGWEQFTDAVIRLVAERDKPAVFILWGSYAQKKAAFVDAHKHLIVKSPHPSPLSAHNGFFGTKPFSKANAFLAGHGMEEIDWRVE
ncbi:MAG: uracil-DNA glycosylase [Pseudomonadota bacterium]